MRKVGKFMTGMGTGLAVGVAASVGVKMMRKKKKGNGLVKTANKAVKSMGDILDNLQDMLP